MTCEIVRGFSSTTVYAYDRSLVYRCADDGPEWDNVVVAALHCRGNFPSSFACHRPPTRSVFTAPGEAHVVMLCWAIFY